jgi:hypothetical protein
LCSLGDVRAWLQTGPQPHPATDDALLSRLITAASAFIVAWLSRPVLSADWQELRDGGGPWCDETTLAFGVQPVTAVLLVAIDGIAVPPGAPGRAGYVFTPAALTIRGYAVPRRRACILLQYTAGYAVAPPDIAQATLELVCRKYRERTRIGERSRSVGGQETVAYETATFSLRDMQSDIQALLQQYRDVVPILPPTSAPTATDPATLAALT